MGEFAHYLVQKVISSAAVICQFAMNMNGQDSCTNNEVNLHNYVTEAI